MQYRFSTFTCIALPVNAPKHSFARMFSSSKLSLRKQKWRKTQTSIIAIEKGKYGKKLHVLKHCQSNEEKKYLDSLDKPGPLPLVHNQHKCTQHIILLFRSITNSTRFFLEPIQIHPPPTVIEAVTPSSTEWLVIHGRVIMVPCKTWLVQFTIL